MKKLRVTLYGKSPLIMHSPKCVNPLHPIAMEMKKYTSKRKKTEEDLLKISDLEWEAGVYWDDSIGLYIPNECIAATLLGGAKFNKNGTAVARYCHITTPLAQLDIGETQDYDTLKKDNRFRDVRSVCVQRSRVNRTRPRFNTWATQFEMFFEDDKIDIGAVIMAIENAGNYVGLCEMRDRGYGHFDARVEEIE